jgi:hypothetical protein
LRELCYLQISSEGHFVSGAIGLARQDAPVSRDPERPAT